MRGAATTRYRGLANIREQEQKNALEKKKKIKKMIATQRFKRKRQTAAKKINKEFWESKRRSESLPELERVRAVKGSTNVRALCNVVDKLWDF